MGNPPFVGTKVMNENQKEDTKNILGKRVILISNNIVQIF